MVENAGILCGERASFRKAGMQVLKLNTQMDSKSWQVSAKARLHPLNELLRVVRSVESLIISLHSSHSHCTITGGEVSQRDSSRVTHGS